MLATGPRDGTIVSVVKTYVNKVELATGPRSDAAACTETALSATESRCRAAVAVGIEMAASVLVAERGDWLVAAPS